MKISNNALNVLAAKTYKGIGRAWIVKNVSGDEVTNNIVTLLNENTKEDRRVTQEEFDSVKAKIMGSIDKLKSFIDGVVAIGDEDFPFYRGDVKNGDRPVVLFYRGDLSLLDKKK